MAGGKNKKPMKNKSFRAALGGVMAGMCLLLLFLSRLIPVMTLSLPAMAGVLLMFVTVEAGHGFALLVYLASALLSLILGADPESVMLFAAFFGVYPILKSKLEMIKSRIVEYICKFAFFNASVTLAYFLLLKVFSLDMVAGEFGAYTGKGLLLLLLLGNVVFVVYDIAMSRLISWYLNWFQPKYLKRLK